MAKKYKPVTTWEADYGLDWHWFALGGLCDIKGRFYMLHLGFFHVVICRVTKYVEDKPAKKAVKK